MGDKVTTHDEMELKFRADKVNSRKLSAWMFQNFAVHQSLNVSGIDHYYESGPAVVRYRIGEDMASGELTVKQRRSTESTEDRLEIDLKFADVVEPKDVKAFLEATGFKRTLIISKHCHIFWIKLKENNFWTKKGACHLPVTVVLYDVWDSNESCSHSRFLEVEVDKDSDASKEEARECLQHWKEILQQHFPSIGEPINQSLYEIYSGKTYSMEKGQ